MRNRRATVVVMLVVALMGAPRVWQEFGDLWASVQNRTQAKFLGLALNSQVKDQSEVDSARAPLSEYLALNNQAAAPAEVRAPFARPAEAAHRMSEEIDAPEVADMDADDDADFEPELAHDRVSDKDLDSLTHSRGGVSVQASPAANCLAVKEAMPLPPAPLYLSKDEAVGMVALHQGEMLSTFVFEKGSDLPAKIKKAMEDAKVKKARFVMLRNAPQPPLPPSS